MNIIRTVQSGDLFLYALGTIRYMKRSVSAEMHTLKLLEYIRESGSISIVELDSPSILRTEPSLTNYKDELIFLIGGLTDAVEVYDIKRKKWTHGRNLK